MRTVHKMLEDIKYEIERAAQTKSALGNGIYQDKAEADEKKRLAYIAEGLRLAARIIDCYEYPEDVE